MNQKPVKAAIVGCGRISTIYFENLTKRFRIVDVARCSSKSGHSAEKKAEEYGAICSTFEKILSDPEIEIIVNLTPAAEHEAIIRQALQAGKHVYTEKVITPDLQTARNLIDLADSKGLYLCSAPEHFMGSAWQSARELIDNGMLGTVTSVHASMAHNVGSFSDMFRFINEPGGGIGFDYGIYLMTTMVSLLGPVADVCGMLRTKYPNRIHKMISHPALGESYVYQNEDMFTGCLEFASGVLGTIHMNGNTIMPVPPAFMIFGTEGVLSLPNPGTFSGDVKLYRPGNPEPVTWIPAHGFPHDSRGVGIAEMAWAIRLGRKPRTEARLGLHCLEVLTGLKESSEKRGYCHLQTACERPAALPAGHLNIPPITYDEEGALIF